MNNTDQPWRRAHGINVDWLISFVAVVDHRGFGRAAEALHRSQSRVSEHINQLERHLRASLLDRAQRPVQLTDAGEVFLPYARESLNRLDSGAGHVASVATLEEGEVRIGSYASTSTSFLPAVLAGFVGRHPGIRIVLHELAVPDLDQALVADHIGLMLRPAVPSIDDERIAVHHLWREPIHVVLRADDPDLPDPEDPYAALRGRRVVSVGISRHPEQFSTVNLDTDAVLLEAGVDLSQVVYTQHPPALVEFVRAGLGVGVANHLAVAGSETTGLRIIPVPGAFRTVVLCWPRDRYVSEAERTFRDHVLAAALPDGVAAQSAPPS